MAIYDGHFFIDFINQTYRVIAFVHETNTLSYIDEEIYLDPEYHIESN